MRIYFRAPDARGFIQSFLGVMDLKIGATIITLFAIFNKVAGVYGLMAVFTGGTFSQFSLYAYSLATIFLCLYGLKAITDESAHAALLYAHLFTLDHLVSSAWTLFFSFVWYLYTPHDGRIEAKSDAQKDLMRLGAGGSTGAAAMTDEQRKIAAERIWGEEKGFAAAVLVFGWLIKIYFALCLYSYALHLRHGTYRNLPFSKPSPSAVPDTSIPLSSTSSSAGRRDYRYHRLANHSIAEVEEEDWPSLDDDDEEQPGRVESEASRLESGRGPGPVEGVANAGQRQQQGPGGGGGGMRSTLDRLAA